MIEVFQKDGVKAVRASLCNGFTNAHCLIGPKPFKKDPNYSIGYNRFETAPRMFCLTEVGDSRSILYLPPR